MKSAILSFFAAQASLIAAVSVSGAAEGFAKGVTGGGSASAVYPSSNDELVSYLGDDQPRVIVLQKTFDFRGTEGSTTETGCAPYGTGSQCQTAINQNNWCGNYHPKAPSVTVSYDNAGVSGIQVGSDKTIIGDGSSGVIKGKGLKIVGSTNVIVQNIAVTDINPQYVWGGDAITLNDCDMVWVDHVYTARIGRQHIVLGNSACNRVTISNNEIDGYSNWSAYCDTYHYWGLYFAGSNDMVTMKDNYIHHTQGRSPKVNENTILHATNNYFYDNTGHAFEVGQGGYVIAEGNIFQNVNAPLDSSSLNGVIFTSPTAGGNTVCANYLGRNCFLNAFGSSGSFEGTGAGDWMSNFQGKNIAPCFPTQDVKEDIRANAGYGKI